MVDENSWWPCRVCKSEDRALVVWSDMQHGKSKHGVSQTTAFMKCAACGTERRETVSSG